MTLVDPLHAPTIPIYRVTDSAGKFVDSSQDPNFDKEFAIDVYRKMSVLEQMDKILYDAQRQGRISFYMTNFGEENDDIQKALSVTAGKGKQMPVHYGSLEHHFVTISSPLGTQISQAVGSAYAFKRRALNKFEINTLFQSK
uniref:2-oxoisovalerate dehydrogenase subunit alpha n=1 Tax=Parascaris equorum TaxID=6256 RepID=A0A914SGP1_PAREQ